MQKYSLYPIALCRLMLFKVRRCMIVHLMDVVPFES